MTFELANRKSFAVTCEIPFDPHFNYRVRVSGVLEPAREGKETQVGFSFGENCLGRIAQLFITKEVNRQPADQCAISCWRNLLKKKSTHTHTSSHRENTTIHVVSRDATTFSSQFRNSMHNKSTVNIRPTHTGRTKLLITRRKYYTSTHVTVILIAVTAIVVDR